ncbi:hypothetical protein H4R99_007132 [Coemansia sp. RSA 1722]|nr:hypothetical protein IWW45_003806 [Coemansia sp. RSA 485]KAJ2590350.1 hypothetical protein H4R99_007132 [Coemansia sp. RSA 1722]
MALQDYCEELIMVYPDVANAISVDKYLWKYVYYDAIVECRKRLRLHVPLHNLSHTSSITGSIRSSDHISSADSSLARSSRGTSDGHLEEWKRDWWTVALSTLFNEALGYFQCLYSRVTSRLEGGSLFFAVRHLHVSQYRLSPTYLIARRLYLYIGDVYRYQFMYLPLLSNGDIGPVDTASILSLARWTYGRALAMFFDSGQACIQMALLSAYSHNQFDVVFWHMCSLCYSESPAGRGRSAMLNAACAYARQEGGVVDDPIEALIIKLSQTVAEGIGVDSIDLPVYEELLSALNEDLEEIANNTAILNLDSDFWIREYQLSVILASLATMAIAKSGVFAGIGTEIQKHHLLSIQHLAVVLLLRQAMCLKQSLDIGEGHNVSIVYALISLALWMDVWRSNRSLLSDAFTLSNASRPDFASRAELLCEWLVQLVREHSNYDLSADLVGHYADAADSVLPHDISLMGWVSLRETQRQIKYQEIECMKTVYTLPSSNAASAGKLESSRSSVSLPLWSDIQDVLHVSFARVQAMVLNEAASESFPFFFWTPDNELAITAAVAASDKADLQQEPVSVDLVQKQDGVSRTNGHGATEFSEDIDALVDAEPLPKNKVHVSMSASAARNLPEPIRIPDFEFWCDHLPEIQAWTDACLYSTLLASDVYERLARISKEDSHRKKPAATRAIGYISECASAEPTKATPLIMHQQPLETLESWEAANNYLISNGIDDDEEDVPTAEDVSESMRGIISAAVYMSYVKYPGRRLQICTDDEELEFYASWFGLDSVRSTKSKL